MKESKPHPFVAGISDYYFAFYIIGGLLALVSAVSHLKIPIWVSLSFHPIMIISLILYYRMFSKNSNWLSPGELLAGRMLDNDGKKWTNPYGKNRLFFFIVIFINLIIAGNSWDSITRGEIMTFQKWMMSAVYLTILSIGIVYSGKNKSGWIIFLLIPAILGLIASTIQKAPDTQNNVNPNSLRIIGQSIYGGLIFLNLLIFFLYSKQSTKSAPEKQEVASNSN